MAYALAMLVAMPVPAERASRVPTITLSTRAAITHPLLPAQCSPVDGPLPLMRPQPLEACTRVMSWYPAAALAQVGTAGQMHSMLCRWAIGLGVQGLRCPVVV